MDYLQVQVIIDEYEREEEDLLYLLQKVFLFFFVVLGIVLRASCMLGKCSATLPMPPTSSTPPFFFDLRASQATTS
jgi:hypothetical protein